jgi:hypothetical protein
MAALAGHLITGASVAILAADGSTNRVAETVPDELREKLKSMTPEERRAAIKEWREKHPDAAARQSKILKRREGVKEPTPEEREAKRKEAREYTEKRVAELQKKKADGTITEQESRQLERLELFLKKGGRLDALKPRPKETTKGEQKPAADK